MIDERALHRMYHDVLIRGNLDSVHWIAGSIALRDYLLESRFGITPIDVFSLIYRWVTAGKKLGVSETGETVREAAPPVLEALVVELKARCDTPDVDDYGISLFRKMSPADINGLMGGVGPPEYYDVLHFLSYAFNEQAKTPTDVPSARRLLAFTFLAYDGVVPVCSERPYLLVDKTVGMPAAQRYQPTVDDCRRWLLHTASNRHLHNSVQVDVSVRFLLRAPEHFKAYIDSLYA